MAVGPLLDPVLTATEGLDVTVLYSATPTPLDAPGVRAASGLHAFVLAEPYLAGTSAGRIAEALVDIPHRLLSVGVPAAEHRRYGSAAEHDAAHRLDPRGLRERISAFL